jgi:hypothetical protein
MKVKELKVQHPEYDAGLLTKYELLYEGGEAFLKQVVLFLPKRHSEAQKLYNERLTRAFYIGYVGPIIDYFSSNLFAFNANISQKKDKNPFYDEFLSNVDLKGTEINDFFREVFTQTLIYRQSYILVDFPSLPADIIPQSKKEEDELGLTRAYLVNFHKKQMIDWQLDDIGNFEWVKFHSEERFKESFNSKEIKRHKWYIYGKDGYQLFQYDEDPDVPQDDDLKEATLVESGKHSLPGRVPIYSIEVPKGLWIMNKLGSIQTELFNLDNALAWQEYQGHYSMPVIKLREGKDFKQKMGESYFIKLDVDESFEWSEPEGKMMEVGLKRREMLKDEMFRVVHQLSLSIKQTKSQTRQSGNSKQEDRYATEVVLRAFGDIIRDGMQNILAWVSEARKESIEWDVSGFSTFDNDSTTEKLAQILQLRAINIHSETFNKEMEKRLIDYYLEDQNQEVKDEIKKEIDKFDFAQIVEDPMNLAFGGNSGFKTPGMSKPAMQGEKPNGVNREMRK